MSYSRSLATSLVAVIGLITPNNAVAQETTASADQTSETGRMGLLRLCFRDVDRGTAIVPDALIIDGRMIFSRVNEAGFIDVQIPEGDRQVLVKAKGYDDLPSKQTSFAEDAPLNALMLDPKEKTPELRPDNLSRFIKDKSSAMAGFVVDEELSRAIKDAEVELLGTDIKTKTDERGFFALSVPMTDAGPIPEDVTGRKFAKKNFKITKPGYGYEERLNVLLETAIPKIFQIRMIPGGGGNAVDEEVDRGGLQSFVFGMPRDPHEHDETTTAP